MYVYIYIYTYLIRQLHLMIQSGEQLLELAEEHDEFMITRLQRTLLDLCFHTLHAQAACMQSPKVRLVHTKLMLWKHAHIMIDKISTGYWAMSKTQPNQAVRLHGVSGHPFKSQLHLEHPGNKHVKNKVNLTMSSYRCTQFLIKNPAWGIAPGTLHGCPLHGPSFQWSLQHTT